jgi:Protein of unknown function (DUF3298)
MTFHPTRRCVVLSLSLLAGGIPRLALAETKPAFSTETKTFEGSVTIEEPLKSSPGLYNDCLAEGRGWVDKMRAEAEKEKRDDPAGFSQGQQWNFDRTYTQHSVVAGRYVSIVRTDATYAGGAHPNTDVDTILWDRSAQKRISIRPFFAETADNGPTMTALAHLVKLAVAKEKMARWEQNGIGDGKKKTPEQFLKDDSDINEGVKPTLLKLGPVTLAPSTDSSKSSGLTFHFSPYAVGTYAEGPYTVFVPWTSFAQFLTAEGKAIFAGQRPGGDADKW